MRVPRRTRARSAALAERDEAADDAGMLKALNQLQRRVVVELSVLAAATVAFLFVFPERATLVNVELALLALASASLHIP